MPLNLKVSGVWKAALAHLRVSGVWKTTTPWVKISGMWRSLSASFTPPGGVYGDYKVDATASITLTCSASCTWTYTLAGGGSAGGSASQASGYVGTSITFNQTCAPAGSGLYRQNQWTVQANLSGYPTENYTLTLETQAS